MAQILVIDDDAQGREMLKFRLQKAGHEVSEATDGEEGLRKARDSSPELIFLDVRLPRLDGWELCRRLKTDPQTQSIPLVMLTGCSQPVQELYGRQCGADEYITKPWEPATVLKAVGQLLFRKKLAMEKDLDALKRRTEDFVLRVIRLVDRLPKTASTDVLGRELVRCAATVGAVYHSSSGIRSPEEFLPKMRTVQKEAEESAYYLNLLKEGVYPATRTLMRCCRKARPWQRSFLIPPRPPKIPLPEA